MKWYLLFVCLYNNTNNNNKYTKLYKNNNNVNNNFRVCSQRKELGVLVYDCSCLALDIHRVFSLYWGLRLRDFIPSFWSKRLFALFNRDEPLEFTLNSTKAQAYVTVSDLVPSGVYDQLPHGCV